MSDTQEKVNILERSEIFLGLPNEVLKKIVTEVACENRIYKANELIINFGDIAEELFIVMEGKVDLMLVKSSSSSQNEVKISMDTIRKGGTFGWSTLTGNNTYGLNAVCAEETKVLAIDGQELLNFLDREPATGYEIMKSLSRIVVLRLRDSNKVLFKYVSGKNIKP